MLIMPLFFLPSCAKKTSGINKQFTEAKVLEVLSNTIISDEVFNIEILKSEIKLKILNGSQKGEEIKISQEINPESERIEVPQSGDKVILAEKIMPDGQLELQIVDYKRTNSVWMAMIIFIACFAVIGGIKGLLFFSFISISLLSIAFVILPLINYGFPAILLSLIFSIGLSALIQFFISNSSTRFRRILISNIISLSITAIISYFLARQGAFSPFISRLNDGFIHGNFSAAGLISSAILLVSIGGIINISVQTFNFANEMKKLYPKENFTNLFLSTVKITRASVFINFIFIFFIYTGLSLPLIISKYNVIPLNYLLNNDSLAFYIMALTSSGIAIVSSNLSSAAISAYYLEKVKSGRIKKATGTLSNHS